jgi:hypothetical protein
MLPSKLRICSFDRAVLAVTTLALAGALAAQRFPYAWEDSPNYIAMAKGLPTLMPWAGRILLPSLAALLSEKFGLTLDHGFEIITSISFILWILIVGERWRATIWTPFFLLTPLTLTTLQAAYITDMLHMGLTALFLLSVRLNQMILAAALMIIMYTARESSMLLAFICVTVLFWHRRYFSGIFLVVGYLVGMSIVHSVTVGAQNVHQMPEIFYLFTKMPANFLRDWLGILIWTNGYAWCNEPVFVVHFPSGLHLGVITEVGFCAPSIEEPLLTLSSYATAFGVLPAILMGTLKGNGLRSTEWKDVWWSTAFLYGALMTILGPIAGPPPDRAIGFGWPLFLMALPAISGNILTWRFAALQVVACWTPLLLSTFLSPSGGAHSFIGVSSAPIVSALSLTVGMAANIIAYNIIRSSRSTRLETFTPEAIKEVGGG